MEDTTKLLGESSKKFVSMQLLASLRSRMIRKWKKMLFLVFSLTGGFSILFISASQSDPHNFILFRERQLTEEQKLEDMGSRYAAEVVKPNEATVYVQPDNLLRWVDPVAQKSSAENPSLQGSSTPRILIVVTSTVESYKRREAIRSTWERWIFPEGTHRNVKIVFFIGLAKANYTVSQHAALVEESSLHNDLVIDNFTESYFRLTPKTLRMLKWYMQTFTSSQTSPDFLVKTDHDVFLNIPNLVSHLTSVFALGNTPYLGGRVYSNPTIDLNPQSKFYFSPEFWLNSTTPRWLLEFKNYFGIGKSPFPDYVSGPCYIMSADVVHLLYEASFITPLVVFEDVYITGFVRRQLLNLSLYDIPFPKIELKLDRLRQILRDDTLLEQAIALHPAEPPEIMTVIYDSVLRLPGT